MNEDVKQMRSAFLESLETARRCERSGVGWPDWVESDLDALIAAVEREALERAAKVCDDLRKVPVRMLGGVEFEFRLADNSDCAEAIRALIESKEGMVIETKAMFFHQPETLRCDGNCAKAWGHNNRPKVRFDPSDEDDYAYLADDELGDAPSDPGTYEGGHGKPAGHFCAHNKWCWRECERSQIGDRPLPDFSVRVYNQPWKHPQTTKEPPPE